jgi:hypothetical protein
VVEILVGLSVVVEIRVDLLMAVVEIQVDLSAVVVEIQVDLLTVVVEIQVDLQTAGVEIRTDFLLENLYFAFLGNLFAPVDHASLAMHQILVAGPFRL